ncbi:unnamed protein product [Didymodactylos carnosus]|uniref:G-protein coupled receptors family 1 profile domain-containing protein n=1 Tax=Didymodactylos carnosus TaxID=1234261 RepID=A0A814UD99_9BILA|nr:unnamed protein product [Didymodactylos carnosus]CAF1357106.1 unnamed protein product [Didymodactylos carnosus]CAF3939089.1 unnamed protein product [Didymodactylos carnosus]CAF4167331.1 unnamed protein product [Didymodactylos carnosus]
MTDFNLNITMNSSNAATEAVWKTLGTFYKIIYRGYFTFLIVFGTSFNILAAIILLRPKLRRFSTCRYMAVCSILNVGVLLTNTLYMMLVMGFNIDIRGTVFWCRMHVFISQWFRGFASWTLVIVAIDRYKRSRSLRPKTSSKNNSNSEIIIVCIAGLILIFPNIHYLVLIGDYVKLESDGQIVNHYACTFLKNNTNSLHSWLASSNAWLELITIIFIPSILTLIFNIFIIKNSFISSMHNEHLQSRSRSRTRRVTTMLLASNIGFLALVSPAQIFYALTFDPVQIKSHEINFFSYMIKAQLYQCLINTYYAMNFVLCFASSSIFRREIKKFIVNNHLNGRLDTASNNRKRSTERESETAIILGKKRLTESTIDT